MEESILKEIFGDLIDIPFDDIKKYDDIIINVNSMLSPLMHVSFHNKLKEDNLYTKSYVQELALELMQTFAKQFIDKYNYKKVVFIYKELGSKNILNNIYHDWRKRDSVNENSFVSIMMMDTFLEVLKGMIGVALNVSLINACESEASFLPRLMKMNKFLDQKSETLIISRDHLDLVNAIDNTITVYNGRGFYNQKETIYRKVLEPCCVTPVMLPYVLLISGSKKLGYKGYPKYGIFKAIEFIKKYGHDGMLDAGNIKEAKERMVLSHILEYSPLFFIYDYITYHTNNHGNEFCKIHQINSKVEETLF